ncbi:hypothetical protein SORBI_3009G172100 [Sorghum bicolor]|uniref:Zinc finger GRF-type domain-containing protein n=1 Tax=Sorghum bicolor TaxID=4558 RepID=A0A1B6P8Z7_SORBI|nr:hypothetical protein SORBI_3009G172100 [Sorghum bicolor]
MPQSSSVNSQDLLSNLDGPDPVDLETGLPLIVCQSCKDVRLIALTSTRQNSCGKRFFKCPRNKEKDPTSCRSYYFQADYETLLRGIGKIGLPRETTPARTQSLHSLAQTRTPDASLPEQIDDIRKKIIELSGRVSTLSTQGSLTTVLISCILTMVFLVASIVAILAALVYFVVANK